jgi:pSer/pThr/pTyr-binding forkhead associated (FHA) protein
MKARIRVVNAPLAGQTVEIGARLLVGREADCNLRLPGGFVSRHHCALMFDGFTLRLLDLGSKNGTFINGHRIANGEANLLQEADLVSVGDTTFIIEVSSQPGEIENQLPPSSAQSKGTDLSDTRTAEDGAAALPPLADSPQQSQRPLA